MSSASRLAALAASLVVTSTLPATARAEDRDLVVSSGLIVSFTPGAPRFTLGVGVECSVLRPDVVYAGGVAQAQVFTDGTFRASLAAQASFYVAGLATGLAVRSGNDARAWSLAWTVSPFLSAIWAYTGYDLHVTLGARRGVAPFEHLITVGAKLPVRQVRSDEGVRWEVITLGSLFGG